MKRLARVVLGLIVALACAGGLLAASWYFGGTTEYARFKSPDERYEVVVYRHPMLLALPGQGSDAPGTIVLLDAAGRELQSTSVGMVQQVSEPRWSEDAVAMKLLFRWKLPDPR